MAARILGQRAATNVLATLYAVPASREAVCSTLVALNYGTAAAAVRVTVAPGGAADTNAHRLLDLTLDAGSRLALTEGWALAAGDVVRVSGASVAFTLFGSEIGA